MSCKLSTQLLLIAFASVALALTAYADDTKSNKHVFVPPVDVTQALKIRMETKATEDLLRRGAEQCMDADCKKQVEECRKTLATCVIVPSKASVHEQEMENNSSGLRPASFRPDRTPLGSLVAASNET